MRPALSTFVLPIIACSILAACGAANGESRKEQDDGPSVTRNFQATGFDAVTLAASDDVQIVQGNAFSVVATGSERTLDRLKIEVDGETLKIGRKRDGGWMRWNKDDRGAKITITMPVLTAAVVAGSGDMKIDTTGPDQFEGMIAGSGDVTIERVLAKNVELSVAGSGNLAASGLQAEALDATIAGSGDMMVSGNTRAAEISIAGSGDVDAAGLMSGNMNVSIAGSGNVRAKATGKVEASIIGSGDVEIAGTKDCTVSKRGSGEVRCTG